MSARAWLKGLLHQELFFLEPPAKQAFRYALADDRLRQTFSQNGQPLGSDLSFLTKSSRKWKLLDLDENKVYLVKDLGDRLVVIGEKHPRVCRLLEGVLYEITARFKESRSRLHRWCLQETWALKKRWSHKPRKLLVNLGAGAWYVRDWKVLEYQGQCDRFARLFVDFEHDMT